MNFETCKVPEILHGHIDTRFGDTIYNHFNDPKDFMKEVSSSIDHPNHSSDTRGYIEQGGREYNKIDRYDLTYDKVYQGIALKVRDRLIARGFTTRMLYGDVGFTSQKTGNLSKQRALMGRKDCYFTNGKMTDGKMFHDLYINLSYSWGVPDRTIKENAYALYALTKELGKLISMRVIVVNHVGTNIPTCYSYILKQFGRPINPREFLFFLSDVKRTYGWATYHLLNKDNSGSTVGRPENTVSIANLDLDKEIDSIWEVFQQRML